MTHKQRLPLALVVVLTASCDMLNFETTGQAITSTYRIGSTVSQAGTSPSEIKYLYERFDFPDAPFQPSASAAFSTIFTVDNGGYHLSNGQGNLNKIMLRSYLVKATPTVGAYYAVTYDIWFANATGHTVLTQNLMTMTAWPRWHIIAEWRDDYMTFDVYDALWNYVPAGHVTFPLRFYVSPAMAIARSPEVDFAIDSNSAVGCRNDILLYDENVHDTGHWSVNTYFGHDFASQVLARVSAPLTNSMCSMLTNHYAGTDEVQWSVSGF